MPANDDPNATERPAEAAEEASQEAAEGPLSDLALLRAYEPILAYTRGEDFLPTDVAGYVEGCSL